MTSPDPRLNAWRPDLADLRLQGRVVAERFVEGRFMQVSDPVVGLFRGPRADARQVSQALMGERVLVFDMEEGWAWGQLETDGYVGYLAEHALSSDIVEPTHRVVVPSTFLYPEPDLKSQPALQVTLNAAVTITGADGNFSRLADGRFAFTAHLKLLGEFAADFVAVAEKFLHVPYYWGGKSVRGLDCSGLVQLALQACGMTCARDSDMQERDLGKAIPANDLDGLRRGDLVFWNGHVGIIRDAETLLHANGHHMLTVAEPLREAIARIPSPITAIKRLQ